MGAAPKVPVRKTVAEIAAKLDELPTLPSVIYELNRVINDPMSSTSDVERLMANDQSLTTKVLKLANSAYYAIPGGVSSLQRAIAYIGYDTINQLALSASIIKALSGHKSVSLDLPSFWKHSLGVAMAAEVIAKEVKYKTPSDLFTCGLVHDMGKVAIFIIAEPQFGESVAYAKEHGLSLLESEEALGLPKHTHVGFELATKWRLPYQIQISISNHHQRDPALRGGLSQEANLVVDIVYLANLLVHALQFGFSGHQKVLGLPRDVLDRLSIPQDRLKDLIAKVKEKIQNAEGFLKIIGDP
ncbi:MAG: HDOD domain-containing protein [Bdellovibrionales bacterium]|jgi:putative nucleotidyltransferase with HDIG domain|nr:HDOD domain-containing protein [Bdellovibrionales bacterium]MBL7689724.1 HDOD domain-containing protein [Pseudobdellovibrionaceae bacterium]